MILHENRLLADDSYAISYLIFLLKVRKDVAKFVAFCSCDWHFKGETDCHVDILTNNLSYHFETLL